VLKYRVAPHYQHPVPLMDMRRAVKLVRSRADEFAIARDRIGVLGFSAGGHLAACAATAFDTGDPNAEDLVNRWSSRPDALVLLYPVISMDEFCHEESRKNLLGVVEIPEMDDDEAVDKLLERTGMVGFSNVMDTEEEEEPQEKLDEEILSSALLDSLSAQKLVTERTPPTFLVHTVNDSTVTCDNSLLFAEALRNAGIPVELHLYEEGPHGFGLALNQQHLATWTGLCARWLQLRGFVGKIVGNDD